MRPASRALRTLRARCGVARWLWIATLAAQIAAPRRAAAEIQLPETSPDEKITIEADASSHWTEGAVEVWLLQGHCLINQGLTYARANEAVLWIERGGAQGDPPNRMTAYLEGDVTIDYQQNAAGKLDPTKALAARLTDKRWFGRFASTRYPVLRVANPAAEPRVKPAVFEHALAAREGRPIGDVVPVQFTEPVPTPAPQPAAVPPAGTRRIRVFPRSDARVQAQLLPIKETNELVAVVTSGVDLVIDGLGDFGSIDVKTDRLVMWTSNVHGLDLSGQSAQHESAPLEIYMEGNIEFRQGERVIFANQMYYDVRQQTGIILGVDLLTPVPNFEGVLRLRADAVQQLDRDRFVARNASLTTSRLGVPTYEFRSGELAFQDIQQPVIDPVTGQPLTTETGDPVVKHQRLATSNNNFVYLEEVPIFYWPTFATDLEKANYYVDSIRFKNDKIFGTALFVNLDAYQLLGVRNKPEGTKFDVSLDYLSKRGPAAGTTFTYDRPNLFGFGNRAFGSIDLWGIDDRGTDDLGRNRRTDAPEDGPWRGRVLARHRHYLTDNFQLTAEIGLISDRNLLEQYFEHEWDEFKDQSTDIELKQYRDNSTWSIYAEGRPNSFLTDTQWLPKLDHFLIGQPLLNDTFTWFEHSSVSYAQLRESTLPTNPQDAPDANRLPWEAEVQGERTITRQELDWPFDLGPLKIVPYALGEVGHWGQALNGNDLNRAYGQFGFRTSLPVWSVEPAIESQLFNVHGIAHKMTFDADISFTEATQSLDKFALYEPLDDNNIEQFRRFFPPPAPTKFDERFYAMRYGMAGWVTSPSQEIANDILTARLGWHQRWQTKRGSPVNRRIIDWITLDTEVVLFPDAVRDNFGSFLGLADYDFRWFVGDRLTLTSEGAFDFFSQGPKYFSAGAYINRPPRGSMYTGVRVLEGPISSVVLASYYSYRMSPKYVGTFGSTYDLSSTGNIGESLTVTRVGESFLVTLGFNVDASKGSVGANFAIEPRVLRGRLGGMANLGALAIPPAGALGLE